MEWTDIYASRQNKTILKGTVTGVEDYTVNGEEVPCLVLSNPKGLIPLPESGITPGSNKYSTLNRMVSFIGQEITFIVIAIDRENELYIASRKAALEKISQHTWNFLKEDQIRTAVVRKHLRTFTASGKERTVGLVVEIDGVEGLLPAGEISHGYTEEIPPLGEQIKVKVIKADKETGKLVVSRKAVLPDPWPVCAEKYKKGGIYTGTVTGIAEYGVFVTLEPGVASLCRHPRVGKVSPGDRVAVTILSVNPDKKRIAGFISRVILKAS